MNYISHYLAHHLNYENAIFVILSEQDLDNVFASLEARTFKSIVLINGLNDKMPISNANFPDCVCIKSPSQIKSMALDKNTITILSDMYLSSNEKWLSILKVISPLNLLILRDFNSCAIESMLTIWESIKDAATNVEIITKVSDGHYTRMVWEKTASPVELSVIFPVYNVEKYIEQSIKTATAWKAPYVEFLFIDDGSTDKSALIIRKYMKYDKRIKLISKQNGGCASARQLGLEKSKGKYITFMDPDDFVDATIYPKLLNKAMEGNYDIVWCDYYRYYSDRNILNYMPGNYTYTSYVSGTSYQPFIQELINKDSYTVWNKLFKKSFLEKNGINFYTQIRRFDDMPFVIQAMSFAKKVASVPEALYYYRLSRPGQDVNIKDERLFVNIDIFNLLDDFFAKQNLSANAIKQYKLSKDRTNKWVISLLDKKYIKNYKLLIKQNDKSFKNKLKSIS